MIYKIINNMIQLTKYTIPLLIMPIKIIFCCPAQKGETIYIVGSHKNLGEWKTQNSLQLKGRPIATATVLIQTTDYLEFKAYKLVNSTYLWEFPGEEYNRRIPTTKSHKIVVEFQFNKKETIVKVISSSRKERSAPVNQYSPQKNC